MEVEKLARMMLGIRFKIAFTKSGKNRHVIMIQQSVALGVPPGGASKLQVSALTSRKEATGRAQS